ncbi:MAG TPA: hypothetical protein VF796_25910 [Humisphaera sp.]
MRRTLIVWVVLLGVLGTIAGVGVTFWQLKRTEAALGARPTKADLDAADRARRAAADQPPDPWPNPHPWWKRTTIDAYDAATGPRVWPGGRRAIVAFARDLSGDPTADGTACDVVLTATDAAADFDCDDPLLLYVRWLYLEDLDRWGNEPFPKRSARRSAALAAERFMTDAKYPAYWRCLGLLAGARALAETPGVGGKDVPNARGPEFAKAAVGLFPAALADADLPSGALTRLVRRAAEVNAPDGSPAVDALMQAFDGSAARPSAKQTAWGEYHIKMAWAARGSGYANTVTSEGWRLFRRSLDVAKENLEAAYAADPTDAEAATLMITVAMGAGLPREEMERWYARAEKARPGNEMAARAKLLYLQPKWHGSPEDVDAFMTELGNPPEGGPTRLAAVCADVLWEAEWRRPRARGETGDWFGYDAPGWERLKRAYERYLDRTPDDHYHRSRYAMAAWRAGDTELAKAQLAKTGGRYSRRVFTDPQASQLKGAPTKRRQPAPAAPSERDV